MIKSKGGQSKFKKEYIEKLEEYFDIDSNFLEKIETSYKTDWKEFASNLPTLQGFCSKIKISRETFYQWLREAEDDNYKKPNKKDKKDLSDTYKICKEHQEKIFIENGLKGLYNPGFARLVSMNVFNWKEKTETDANISGGLKINSVKDMSDEELLNIIEEEEGVKKQ